MTTDFRAMCVELTEVLRRQHDWYIEDNGATLPQLDELVVRAETALAEPYGPAVSDDREPASVTDTVTHQLHRRATILLIRKVIDQAVRDTASVHWRVADTGEQLVRASDLVAWADHMEKQMEQTID